jgi:hypothetical protein
VVTKARLDQGLREIGGVLEKRSIAEFVKWIEVDVLKEARDELDASELTWKLVKKPINRRASKWFMRQIQLSEPK